jgi:hypothetical protein
MSDELMEQIKAVALARENAKIAKESKDAAYSAWEREYKSLLDSVDETAKHLQESETKLREMTIKIYQETGNKQPAPGIGIREITRVEYDPKQAVKWAIEHKIALSLDKKSFEGWAKANQLDFVKISTEPQAIIATDLSAFLSEAVIK